MRRIGFFAKDSRPAVLVGVPVLATLALVLTAVVLPAALAGSPHFVSNTVTATRTDNSLTVSGKEAGLGDEAQVHIVVSATAVCINPGGNHPKAENKQSVSSEGNSRCR